MPPYQADFSHFKDFYPYYLSEHSDPVCRRLHYFGSTLVLILAGLFIARQTWGWLPLLLVAGYGPAWVGHFVFEKNRPATFRYPLYSFMGDWVMYKDMLTGKIPF